MKDLGVANINIEQKNLGYPSLKIKDYNDGNSTYLTRDS
jgi:hypothetical protein